jgi:platelet-activating factor acetylhydrolase
VNHSTKANHPWLPPPVDLIAQGFARFTNGSVDYQLVLIGLQSLAGGVTIPAQVDVPLYGNTTKFPVLIFSHGDATIPTFYSQYCGELASRGNIVAVIEHRDGSGAGSVILMKDGTTRNVSYLTADQLS